MDAPDLLKTRTAPRPQLPDGPAEGLTFDPQRTTDPQPTMREGPPFDWEAFYRTHPVIGPWLWWMDVAYVMSGGAWVTGLLMGTPPRGKGGE